jgi:hypothetical protein
MIAEKPDLKTLLESKKWVYHLDQTKPDPSNALGPQRFRVCVIVDGESGYFPMGDTARQQQPWYWDEATCREENQKLGHNEEEVIRITVASMFGECRKPRTSRKRRRQS